MFHLFRKDIEKHCAYCKSGSSAPAAAWSTLPTTAVTFAMIRSNVCRLDPPRCAISIPPRIFPCKAGQRPEQ